MATIATNFYLRKPVYFSVTSVPEQNTDNWSIKALSATNTYVTATKTSNTTFSLMCTNAADTTSTVNITIGFEDNGTPNYIAERNISFQWSGTYIDIFENFYVLIDNQWVLPSSGKSIKVGNVDAVYQGNGLWFVSMDDVATTDNVYVDGVSFGTFGKEIYTDGSDETKVDYITTDTAQAFRDGYTPYSSLYNSVQGTWVYGVMPDDNNMVYFKIPEGAQAITSIVTKSSYGFCLYNNTSGYVSMDIYADGNKVLTKGATAGNVSVEYSTPYYWFKGRASEVYVKVSKKVPVGVLCNPSRSSFYVTYSVLPDFPNDSETI